MPIVCEGVKRKLKHLKKDKIFILSYRGEWIGNFRVLEEMDETGIVLVKNVSPGIGEAMVKIIFTEENLYEGL